MFTFPKFLGAFVFYSKPSMICILTFMIMWYNIFLLMTEFMLLKLFFCLYGLILCYFVFASAMTPRLL